MAFFVISIAASASRDDQSGISRGYSASMMLSGQCEWQVITTVIHDYVMHTTIEKHGI